MLALLSHPDQYRRLLTDRALLPGAVEEMLRWWTPVMHFRRTATEDLRLSDVDIRFDIGRTPNAHLAFGHGPHFVDEVRDPSRPLCR